MASGCCIGRQRESLQISYALIYAVSEWLLIFLLFLNALFSFLITKFAQFCKLQAPCLLCSRLDHILGGNKPGFYRDLVCDSHKLEISSLAYCHVHRKLARVNEMCESCLLSFATEKKSNPETYRSLVSKLGVNFDDCINGDDIHDKMNGEDAVKLPLLAKGPVPCSPIMNNCPCCSVPFVKKSRAVKLPENSPVSIGIRESDVCLSNSIAVTHLHHQDRLSENRESSLGSPSTHHLGNQGFDRLSRVGYSEVKVTSDSESENAFSDDDGGNRLADDLKEGLQDRCLKPEPASNFSNYLSMYLSDDTDTEKLIHPTSSELDSSLSIPHDQLLHVGEPRDLSLPSAVRIGQDLEEINPNKINERINPSPIIEQITPKNPSGYSNAKLNDSDTHEACTPTIPVAENPTPVSSSDPDTVAAQITTAAVPSTSINMDLNDAYKLAISSKASLTSPTFTEVITGRDSSRVYGDLKLLISQISAARSLESPWRELSPSPRVQGQVDDLKFFDASKSPILQNITNSLSIERNESGLESLDGSVVSEFEGESPVDRLKRQVELDRKSMYLLYKELEEERSASAIAANQAMAMITRLQEEKATMQMEALQYQRMMEEQSEYDQEALQKLNELLDQKDKEIQHLEAEVENYRKQFSDKSVSDSEQQPSGHLEAVEYGFPSMILEKKSRVSNESDQIKSDVLVDPFLDFEDEKAYITNCLKTLEKKLHMFSNNWTCADMKGYRLVDTSCGDENGDRSGQNNDLHFVKEGGSDYMERHDWNSQEFDLMAETLSAEDSSVETSSSLSLGKHIKANRNETTMCSDSSNDIHHVMDNRLGNLAALLNEVSQLNDRLKALEADHNFLEHTINTLRNDSDGVRFIQEIACHLQELRRFGITLRA